MQHPEVFQIDTPLIKFDFFDLLTFRIDLNMFAPVRLSYLFLSAHSFRAALLQVQSPLKIFRIGTIFRPLVT